MEGRFEDEVWIKKLGLGQYNANCYIVACPQTREGVIIDAPAEAERILAEAEGVKVASILITHAHFDHLGALAELKSALGARVATHPKEVLPQPPDFFLEEGDLVQVGTVSLKVIHTPGHTAGSICLLTGRHLFSGDTLFPGGPGKTQTPSHFLQIVENLEKKIFILPDDTLVYPGHGEGTVLAKEKGEFRQFRQRPSQPDLCGDVLWLAQ
ncbi:MAG: MBL fold metallo-hydrolase [Chloroflexi bacterium]|nr:MBL fold metallo-hydrolase [Chloroflexota bacterium]